MRINLFLCLLPLPVWGPFYLLGRLGCWLLNLRVEEW